MNREVVLTYLNALIQSTEKKGIIIDELTRISKLQEEVTQTSSFELDEFIRLIDQKEPWIKELETIDNGFGQTFDRIKDVVLEQKETYEAELKKLQSLIGLVTEKAVALQALERRNKLSVDRQISEKKKKMAKSNLSNKVASSYYKNMANTHYNQSYFMDKRK